MANGTTPAGLIRRGQRQIQTRGALGMSNISKEAQDVFRMLSGYLTDIKERRLSGGEKATEVEKEQKKQGDLWGYGSGLVSFLFLTTVLKVPPDKAAQIAGMVSTGVRKGAEDKTREKVGVGGIALGKDELPLPPKPKYYQTQYEKLPIARGEAKFDLENLYQMGRQMALPRSLSTGWNVYRGANLASDLYSGWQAKGDAPTIEGADVAGLISEMPGEEIYESLLGGALPRGASITRPTSSVDLTTFLRHRGGDSRMFTGETGEIMPGFPMTRLDWIRDYIKRGRN
jgi:hypothetical protein